MAHNQGLLVDVEIETGAGASGAAGTNSSSANLTLAGGGGSGESEVNGNNAKNKNIFDSIETVQSYQSTLDSSDNSRHHRERINSVDSTNSVRSYDSTGKKEYNDQELLTNCCDAGVESAHSGEALLPDVGYTSSSGGTRSTPRQKKNKRGENTPLIRSGRNRSDYEDLDDEAFNNWPSKYFISIHS